LVRLRNKREEQTSSPAQRRRQPYIIFEVKSPSVRMALSSSITVTPKAHPWCVVKWEELVILHREEPNVFTQISAVPTVDQTLQDVIPSHGRLIKYR
jgi:hypothetical protein